MQQPGGRALSGRPAKTGFRHVFRLHEPEEHHHTGQREGNDIRSFQRLPLVDGTGFCRKQGFADHRRGFHQPPGARVAGGEKPVVLRIFVPVEHVHLGNGGRVGPNYHHPFIHVPRLYRPDSCSYRRKCHNYQIRRIQRLHSLAVHRHTIGRRQHRNGRVHGLHQPAKCPVGRGRNRDRRIHVPGMHFPFQRGICRPR